MQKIPSREKRTIQHGKMLVVNEFGRRETFSRADLIDVAYVNDLAMDRLRWFESKMRGER